MEIEISYIVESLAGRDSGKLFVVMDVCDAQYVLLVDGKMRKLESPKRKKRKHVLFYAVNDTRLGDKIRNNEKITNAEIRRTLSEITRSDKEGNTQTDARRDTLGEG